MTEHEPQNPLDNPESDAPLRIGARGWLHPGWEATFYPDDLPEEWRLGYYANEFSTVLLPAEQWLAADGEALAEWAEEAHEGFRFVLESDGASAERLSAAAQAMGERLGGWLEGGALWRPEGGVAGSRVGLLPPGPHGPRQLRDWLESFVAQAPEGARYLFLEGAPPESETLHALVTLRDLIGC